MQLKKYFKILSYFIVGLAVAVVFGIIATLLIEGISNLAFGNLDELHNEVFGSSEQHNKPLNWN